MCGRKHWQIAAPEHSLAQLQQDQVAVWRHVQEPGSTVYVPAGYWHSTCNDKEEALTVGFGGLGASPGLHLAAARGDLQALSSAAPGAAAGSCSEAGLGRSLLATGDRASCSLQRPRVTPRRICSGAGERQA